MTRAVEVSLQEQRGPQLAGGNDYLPSPSDFLNELSDS